MRRKIEVRQSSSMVNGEFYPGLLDDYQRCTILMRKYVCIWNTTKIGRKITNGFHTKVKLEVNPHEIQMILFISKIVPAIILSKNNIRQIYIKKLNTVFKSLKRHHLERIRLIHVTTVMKSYNLCLVHLLHIIST